MFANNYNNDKEDTYYLTDFSNTINKIPYLNDEYNKQVGYWGNKLIQTPYLSDNTKLNIIEKAKPEYAENINFVKKVFPTLRYASNLNNKYLINKDLNAENQYKMHSDIINYGGRRKYKSKSRKHKTKSRKHKTKSRKYKLKSKKI